MTIKKQGKLFFIFAACLICLAAKSVGDVTLLTRTWKLADLRHSAFTGRQLPPSVEKAVEDMKKGFTLTYRADGTYTAAMDNNLLGGKWQYSADSALLSVVTTSGDKKDYKVVQLTSDTFAFITREGKEDTEFVMVPADGKRSNWIWIAIGATLILAVSGFIAYRGKSTKA